MKISVVGVGYVGLVVAAGLAEVGNHVVCIDKDKEKIDNLNNGVIPIYEPGVTEIIKKNEAGGRLVFTTDIREGITKSKVIFIGVGTPSAEDGSADISVVLSVAEQIAENMSEYKIIVTKSTVPVGTYKKVCDIISSRTDVPFDYVSNPEFLKEGSAVDDFLKPDRVIIGTANHEVREVMKQLYTPFMRKNSRIMFMDAASAEMTKYAANAMLATRISFMNELSGLCEKYGADIEHVRKGIGSDSRIGNSFLFAGLGYGGSCFPKDVKALIHMGQMHEYPMTIVQAVQLTNDKQQSRFAEKVIKYYEEHNGQVQLGVWGLAFKARTDDIRESPAIGCVEKFIEAGLKVKAFDPAAMGEAAKVLGARVELVDQSYDVLEGSSGLVVLTDWQEFRTPDFEQIAAGLKEAVIFDGRNLYSPEYVQEHGIEYHGIGRGKHV